MRISRLTIQDLRRHAGQLQLDLAPGLTIVRGPNESGKTTVQRALELILFKRATFTGADLEALRPWGVPEGRPTRVAIEFVQEELDGLHTGRVEKTFRGPKGSVKLEIDGETTTDPGRADDLLAALTGIPTENFFRSTASVRHYEVHDLDRDEAALRDRLQASISGADRGTSRAKRQIERRLGEMNARGAKNPGDLKRAEDAVAEAEARLRDGESALGQLERDRDTLVVARDKRAEVERLLAERKTLLEKARQAERLTAERDGARERFERYRQAVEVSSEVDRLQGSHPSGEALPVLRQIVERLRGLDKDITRIRAEIGDEHDVEFEVKVPKPVWRPWLFTGAAFILLGLAGAGLILLQLVVPAVDELLEALPVVEQLGADMTIGLVALLAVLVGVVFVRRSRELQRIAEDVGYRQELHDAEIARRLRGRSQLKQELQEKEADFDAQLEAFALPDLAAAEDLLRREEEHVAAIDRLAAQLEGLVGKEPVETLPPMRDAAALEIEQKTHALEALGPIAKEPRARERLEVEVRDAEAQMERARDDEASARARVEANPVDAEAVASDAERLAADREHLSAVERRGRILARTLEAIRQAEEATMKRATRYLEKRMVGDIARISGGRYRRVQVDDRTFDISVFAPERNDWVDVRQLSQGTLDQVYLAARLGLVRLVTQDRRPPLVFDDPFITFDDERARRSLELLRDLAADFQVIYLTTSDRYDDLADKVLELPAPAAVDDRAPAEDETAEAVTASPG